MNDNQNAQFGGDTGIDADFSTNKRIDDIEADLRTLIDKMERVEQSITNLNHKIKQSEVG